MKHIIQNRIVFFIISGTLILISLSMMLFWKLNLGIDMTGGISNEYSYSTFDQDAAKDSINTLAQWFLHEWSVIINATNIYKISWEDKVAVVIGFDNSVEEKTLNTLKDDFREQLLTTLMLHGDDLVETKYTNIWKSFGDYIKNTAIITLIIAIIAITLYITWAFSGVVSGINFVSFSSITIITLFHDIVIATGLYIAAWYMFPEFQIDTFFVTALLTILGYSINDTIVIFDRIRSNLKDISKKWNTLESLIQKSIGESITRSIYTSVTLLFVLVTVFLFGPESISWFTLVMIFGTIVGTYSSICIASPLLYEMNKNKKLSKYVQAEYNPDDKIVV